MRLRKLNSWMTLAANLGVVGGLIFLGLEIRQGTAQMRAEASYSINEGVSGLNAAIYNDPVLAEIVARGESDFSSLSLVERSQFSSYEFDRINLAIHISFLQADGISNVHFPYIEFLVQDFHAKPGLQQFLVSVENSWVGPKDLYERLRTQSHE